MPVPKPKLGAGRKHPITMALAPRDPHLISRHWSSRHTNPPQRFLSIHVLNVGIKQLHNLQDPVHTEDLGPLVQRLVKEQEPCTGPHTLCDRRGHAPRKLARCREHSLSVNHGATEQRLG